MEKILLYFSVVVIANRKSGGNVWWCEKITENLNIFHLSSHFSIECSKNWQILSERHLIFSVCEFQLKVKRFPSKTKKLRPKVINHSIKCVCIELTSSIPTSHIIIFNAARISFLVEMLKLVSFCNQTSAPSECELNLSWCQFGVRFSKIDYDDHPIIFHSKNVLIDF